MASRSSRGRQQTEGLPLDLGDARAAQGGATLPGTAVRPVLRRVERAVGDSIRAARGETPADPRWAAAEALARELGRGLDLAAANADPYALAQLGPKLLDALRELSLTPASSQTKGDLENLLADLAKPMRPA